MKGKDKRPRRQGPTKGEDIGGVSERNKDTNNYDFYKEYARRLRAENRYVPQYVDWRTRNGNKIYRALKKHGAASVQVLQRETGINHTAIRTLLSGMIREGYAVSIGKRHNYGGKGNLAEHFSLTDKKYSPSKYRRYENK